MLAFVLSGGGNRGALQVGALQVLLEAGIQPDVLVGTSVGAVNALFLACDPTPQGGLSPG
ncbi:MAG: patatin-like phospholipase family protein [Ardenticatenia bacterium]|nr:patatin-like phospholipase family protein [Ardenticatenia bacterium]